MERSVEELVALARDRGDGQASKDGAEAFAQLILRFEPTALSIAYARLANAADAGDVVQEAFLRAWERLDTLDDASRFAHWLGRMVRNLAIDLRRRRKSLPLDDSFDPPAGGSVDDAIQRREQAGQIDRALQSLDDVSRECVVLRYYQELSSREIGELLELSPAAVDMRISRARGQLKERLAGMFGDVL